MENRFGMKDMVIVALLVVIIVVAAIGLRSAGRQAEEIHDIAQDVEKMQGEVQRLRDQIEQVGKELESDPDSTSALPAIIDSAPEVE